MKEDAREEQSEEDEDALVEDVTKHEDEGVTKHKPAASADKHKAAGSADLLAQTEANLLG